MKKKQKTELQKLATHLILDVNSHNGQGRALFLSYSMSGEGNTTLLGELGKQMGQYNRLRTLLVDGNLRSPRLHAYWGIPPRPGLTDVCLSEADVGSAVRGTEYPNVFVLPAGERRENPEEFFTDPRFKQAVDALKREYGLLLFDSPPLLSHNDALVMGKVLDGSLLLTRCDFLPTAIVRRSHTLLTDQGIEVLGGILNRKKDYIPRFIRRLLHSPEEQ